MAIYRNVSLSFWEDNKVVDDFTYKDKYFLLYLLTNPHTNLIGCYEISIKQMSNELGLEKSEVEELLTRMEQVHQVILYAEETKEILIKNWHKYNWTKSEKLKKPIRDNIKEIKSERLRKYMVSIGYLYHIDTTDTDPVTDIDNNIFNNIFTMLEKNFGRTIAPLEFDVIKSWVENNISEELIVYATQIAVCNNACSVKYIERILEDWKRKKIITLSQAKMENDKFKSKKGETPEWFDKPIKKEESEETKEEMEKLLKQFK